MRIVLAYSGGLQMSAAIPWLGATFRAEVVTVTVDLGVGADLEAIRDRALSLGAIRSHVLDLREAFASEYFARALAADATLDDGSPLVTSLAHLLIGRTLVEIAHLEGADTVAHGSVGEALDRLERPIKAIDPKIRILAPARDRHATEAQIADSLHALGVQVRVPEPSRVGRPSGDGPPEPAFVEVTFERGLPTAVNGIPMPLVELVESLGMMAAVHGVRRPERATAAGAFALHVAHRHLRDLAAPAESADVRRQMSRHYVDIVQSGAWFTILREALDAFFGKIHEPLNGTVCLQLFRGECRIVDAAGHRGAVGSAATASVARA